MVQTTFRYITENVVEELAANNRIAYIVYGMQAWDRKDKEEIITSYISSLSKYGFDIKKLNQCRVFRDDSGYNIVIEVNGNRKLTDSDKETLKNWASQSKNVKEASEFIKDKNGLGYETDDEPVENITANILGIKEHLLLKHGVIDVDRSIKVLLNLTGKTELNINSINCASKRGGLFVLENGRILDTYTSCTSNLPAYKIVPTGLYLKGTKCPIFASFGRRIDENNRREVHFGTGEQLFNMYKQRYSGSDKFDSMYLNVFHGDNDIEGFGLTEVLYSINKKRKLSPVAESSETKEDSSVIDEQAEQKLCGNMNAQFVESLYIRLLYKESWMIKGKHRLDYHLKHMIYLLEHERRSSGDKVVGNGYMYSRNKKHCILNLGMIDIYGNEIYIIDSTPSNNSFENKMLSLVDSKQDLINIGFTNDEVKNLPSSFDLTKYHKDCVFNANIEDFDFLDTKRLYHIIEERRNRLPDKFKDESCKVLCDKIKAAVELSIKLSKTDCRYVIPKWDFTRREIQFMIPLHLDSELQDIPELAIIVGKDKDIWKVYTILYIDDAIGDARLLLRTTSWLRDTA